MEKLGSMFFVRGKQQVPATEVVAGDIFALAKLAGTRLAIHYLSRAKGIQFEPIDFPKPN